MSDSKIDEEKPYTWTDSFGNTYRYYRDPLMKVCSFILIQETCERLAFYGIQPTIKSFLRKSYGFGETAVCSFVGLFNGLTYIFALVSAILADTVLGTYLTIMIFSAVYMVGLVMLCIAAISFIDQLWMVYVALWVFLAVGAGGIKSCVSVLGAQQYSPVDHKDRITQFFTLFYASINVGALIGGIVVPTVAKNTDSYTIAYMIPTVAFAIATGVLLFGSSRYVMMKPQGSAVVEIFKVIGASACNLSVSKCRKSQGGKYDDHFIDDAVSLFTLMPLFGLVIPFNICYNQIFMGFETQSTMMKSTIFGFDMAHELMVNVDPIAVIVGSLVIDNFIFPFLRKKNMMPTILYRFVVGFTFSTLANLCAMAVEFAIQGSAENTVSIWWQIPQFSFVAFGEIFVISTSYEVAFSKSPESLKTVASAFNLLGFAIAGFISTALIQATNGWTSNSHWDYYYMVLASMSVVAGIVCFFSNAAFERIFARAEAHNEAATLRGIKQREESMAVEKIEPEWTESA